MLNIIPKPRKVIVLSEAEFMAESIEVTRQYDFKIKPSGYKMKIEEDGILLRASDEAGFYYGMQTIKQLSFDGKLPHIYISDRPRFAYRGFMLDCARHFFTVAEVKKVIDLIAHFKFNIFHWHLTEDQGWRIEINRYPLLTERASYRGQTTRDGKPVFGFYTKEEIKEVVDYAKSLHIDVIPEFDLPGHFSAAIHAYPYLSCDGQGTEVKESFGIFEEVACAGKEETYTFITNVLKEIFEMFPYQYVHLGGDEALRTKWLTCPDCQRVMAENNLKHENDLQTFMMNRIADFCKEHGKFVINWNDGLHGDIVADNIVVHHWREGKKDIEATKRHVEAGKKIIVSPFSKYYLDYSHGQTPLSKTFAFNPMFFEMPSEESLLGIEAPLWTEYVRDFDKIMSQAFPRLIAVAERAWSKWDKDYEDFEQRLEAIYDMLRKEYNYAFTPLEEANPKGLKRLRTLRAFFKQVDKKTGIESLKRLHNNNKFLAEKYGK